MKKIVIIGPSGAGKTTFAIKLGFRLNIQVIHLDPLFWEHGWKKKKQDVRIDISEKIVQQEQWIIEGTYLKSSKPRLDAADTIIFLDMPPLLCLLRVIKRNFLYHRHSSNDLPMGCTDKLTPMSMINMVKILLFPIRDRRELKSIQQNYASKYITFRSSEDIDIFLAQIKQEEGEKQYSTLLR